MRFVWRHKAWKLDGFPHLVHTKESYICWILHKQREGTALCCWGPSGHTPPPPLFFFSLLSCFSFLFFFISSFFFLLGSSSPGSFSSDTLSSVAVKWDVLRDALRRWLLPVLSSHTHTSPCRPWLDSREGPCLALKKKKKWTLHTTKQYTQMRLLGGVLTSLSIVLKMLRPHQGKTNKQTNKK